MKKTLSKMMRFPFIVCLLILIGASNIAYADVVRISSKQNIEWAFTQEQQHPDKLLIKQINSAKKSLDIAIYSLTNNDIVNAVVDAKKKKVNVRIITDKGESKSKYQNEQLNTLKYYDIPIKINVHKGLQHMKVTIVDGAIVTTGSFNYSKSASTVNDEVLVVIKDKDIAGEWKRVFDDMWNDQNGFVNF